MTIGLSELAQKVSTLKSLHSQIIKRVQEVVGSNGVQFDLSKPTPGVERPISDVEIRIIALCELAGQLQSETNELLVPQGLINALNKPLDQLISNYKSISDQFTSIDSNGGPGELNIDGISLKSKNGQIDLQLGSTFQQIWNSSENALLATYNLSHVVKTEGLPEFSGALAQFSELLNQARRQHAELLSSIASIEQIKTQADSHLAAAKTDKDEVQRLKSEAEKDRKTLVEYASEGTQAVTSIRSVNEQSDQLKTAVDEYRVTFDSFQKQLDDRETLIAEGSKRQNSLFANIEEIRSRIQELDRRAEAMLTGATVAGLAGSFGDLRNSLSKDLKFARYVFYAAIGLLFVSVIPLVLYVIPGLGTWAQIPGGVATQTASAPELSAQILARALLLLPAAWFARFAAARHASLFRLKEHYAYKYSVAASVDAFKKQAEQYKDEIAAATFFELTFNPAERMETKGTEARNPNPVMNWLMNKLGATHDGKAS